MQVGQFLLLLLFGVGLKPPSNGFFVFCRRLGPPSHYVARPHNKRAGFILHIPLTRQGEWLLIQVRKKEKNLWFHLQCIINVCKVK